MSASDRRFFSGNSLDQAVMLAARHYGLEPEELRYSVLDKRHGFLRIRRSVVIEVDPESLREAPRQTPAEPPETAPPTSAERPGRARKDKERAGEKGERPRVDEGRRREKEREQAERRVARPPQKETPGDKPWWQQGPADEEAEQELEQEPYEEDDEARDEAEEREEEPTEWAAEKEEDEEEELRPLREQLPQASGAMAMAAEKAMRLALEFSRAEMEMAVLEGDERLEIELWGRDEERILADEGDLLLALQQLMARLIRGFVGETLPVRVDCANFHERRKREVGRLARRIGRRVAERGRGETMEPMAPDERRLVHIALQDDDRVETRSVGRGYYKRVAIEPR